MELVVFVRQSRQNYVWVKGFFIDRSWIKQKHKKSALAQILNVALQVSN